MSYPGEFTNPSASSADFSNPYLFPPAMTTLSSSPSGAMGSSTSGAFVVPSSAEDLAERLLTELSTVPDGNSRPGTPTQTASGAGSSGGAGNASPKEGPAQGAAFTAPMGHLLASTGPNVGGSIMNPVFLSSVIRSAIRDVLVSGV